ncbi:MAG: RDD family protein [archaeon]
MKRGSQAYIVEASVLKRILAFGIDLIVLYFVVVVPFGGVFAKIPAPDESFWATYEYFQGSGVSATITLAVILISIIAILYFSVLEWRLSQSIGKMALKLHVIGDKNLPFWKCVVRSLFLIPVMPFALLWVADPLFMIFSQSHQRLLERVTKTKVIEKYTGGIHGGI